MKRIGESARSSDLTIRLAVKVNDMSARMRCIFSLNCICLHCIVLLMTDFDASSYNNFSMTVVFNRFGHNLVSFCGHDLEGNKVDLGIAFINLPCEVWPSVALSWPGEEASVVVDYTGVSGEKTPQITCNLKIYNSNNRII